MAESTAVKQEGILMRDIVLFTSAVVFFALSIAYVRFCDRIK